MSTYLITGGCGFIGSHLTDYLVSIHHQVIVLDDLSQGKQENLSRSAEFIKGDICNEALLMEILPKVDGCFHLAAVLGLSKNTENCLASHQVNMTGTLILFDAIKNLQKTHQKKIPVVYASSSVVYGDSHHFPLNESVCPTPISEIGADKLACELHARVAHELHDVVNIGLRLFNVYGPRQNSGVIPVFIDHIKNNRAINIYGEGEQTRDFVHVSDVVKFLWYFMENTRHSPNVYNVCTGQTITVNLLVDLLEHFSQKKIRKNYCAPRVGDVMHSCGDVSKALKLGMKADVTLTEGLKALLHLML